ncbi:PAS domain-containing protein [Yoonia sp. BS5-3]|uniref:histidine kinase n=1 Tax=Yoonia phaeophyticola TaxID=3137369 RepID=A0ABZ2V9D7_9RHOB
MHYLQRELQEKLKNDSEIWTFLQQSCLDGIWYWDLEDPEHEWLSPEFWQLFGYDPETKSHTPESWFDIIDPDDKQLALENFEKHLADPNHPYDQVVRYRHADGSTVWIRCRGLALRDAEGRGIRMLGAHTDLTNFVRENDRRGKETARLAARLSAVFNTAHSAIFGLDRARNIVTRNPPARDLLGHADDDANVPWPSTVHFLDSADLKPLDASNDPINRALAGARLGGEVHLMTLGDDTERARYVRISSAPVDGADSDIHTVIVMDDVSEQEKNRQQIERQSRLDALGQLTGGIAHDFNNLLSTIMYANSMLLEEQQSEHSARLLKETQKTILRGRDLVDRLLAFAKQKPQSPKYRNVGVLLEEFFKLAKPTIEEQINVDIHVDGPELSVLCDQHMLDNVLLNLVLNSRDAITRSNEGNKITLSASEVTDEAELAPLRNANLGAMRADQRYVKLQVSDNGPGMAPEVRRRATDPFFSTKSSNSGTGLGLSMVFGFVQQSGGSMRITSEPGEGTQVSLILPMEQQSREEPAAPTGEVGYSGRGETVLLAEDEQVLLLMMKEQLESMGYVVVAVGTGVAAWQLIESGLEFDILVSDVVMPGGVGGFELVRRLADTHPQIPAVLLSGYAGYSAERRDDVDATHLAKPCPPETLDATLRQLLDKAANRQG